MKTKSGLRLKLIWGTPRRLIWNLLRPRYVKKQLAEREGECRRCGACCQLVWKCVHFTEENGLPSCKIYSTFRPPNCSNFPIDHRDIADRNHVFPHIPCGFSWGKKRRSEKIERVAAAGERERSQMVAATTAEQGG